MYVYVFNYNLGISTKGCKQISGHVGCHMQGSKRTIEILEYPFVRELLVYLPTIDMWTIMFAGDNTYQQLLNRILKLFQVKELIE